MKTDNIRNKNCLITGANSGIGKQLSIELGKRKANIIMVCRNKEKGLKAQQEVIHKSNNKNIYLLIFDISLQKSIYEATSTIKDRFRQIDILINNAGILMFKKELTEEQIEKTIATNYFGPFLLSNLILKMNGPDNPCKIINVVSEGISETYFTLDYLEGGFKYNGLKVYSFSKQAEIYFSFELAKRLKKTNSTVNCFYPGLVQTNLGKPEKGFFHFTFKIMSLLMKSKFIPIEDSIQLCIFLLCSNKASEMNGCYLKRSNDTIKVIRKYNKKLSAELWKKTLEKISATGKA